MTDPSHEDKAKENEKKEKKVSEVTKFIIFVVIVLVGILLTEVILDLPKHPTSAIRTSEESGGDEKKRSPMSNAGNEAAAIRAIYCFSGSDILEEDLSAISSINNIKDRLLEQMVINTNLCKDLSEKVIKLDKWGQDTRLHLKIMRDLLDEYRKVIRDIHDGGLKSFELGTLSTYERNYGFNYDFFTSVLSKDLAGEIRAKKSIGASSVEFNEIVDGMRKRGSPFVDDIDKFLGDDLPVTKDKDGYMRVNSSIHK